MQNVKQWEAMSSFLLVKRHKPKSKSIMMTWVAGFAELFNWFLSLYVYHFTASSVKGVNPPISTWHMSKTARACERKKKKRNRELSSFNKNVTLILAALVLWYNLENIGCLVEVMLRCIHLIQLVCVSQWWGKKSTELNAPAIIKTQTRQYK